jgi:hypothetical protein
MREILFRGKTLYATGEQKWVYGNLCHDGMKKGGWCIEIEPGRMVGVDPNTVGQYTGSDDKNGNKIYENDILTTDPYKNYPCPVGIMKWQEDNSWSKFWPITQFKVIGNTFDNPELIPHD